VSEIDYVLDKFALELSQMNDLKLSQFDSVALVNLLLMLLIGLLCGRLLVLSLLEIIIFLVFATLIVLWNLVIVAMNAIGVGSSLLYLAPNTLQYPNRGRSSDPFYQVVAVVVENPGRVLKIEDQPLLLFSSIAF
jgi:hypothetical protein